MVRNSFSRFYRYSTRPISLLSNPRFFSSNKLLTHQALVEDLSPFYQQYLNRRIKKSIEKLPPTSNILNSMGVPITKQDKNHVKYRIQQEFPGLFDILFVKNLSNLEIVLEAEKYYSSNGGIHQIFNILKLDENQFDNYGIPLDPNFYSEGFNCNESINIATAGLTTRYILRANKLNKEIYEFKERRATTEGGHARQTLALSVLANRFFDICQFETNKLNDTMDHVIGAHDHDIDRLRNNKRKTQHRDHDKNGFKLCSPFSTEGAEFAGGHTGGKNLLGIGGFFDTNGVFDESTFSPDSRQSWDFQRTPEKLQELRGLYNSYNSDSKKIARAERDMINKVLDDISKSPEDVCPTISKISPRETNILAAGGITNNQKKLIRALGLPKAKEDFKRQWLTYFKIIKSKTCEAEKFVNNSEEKKFILKIKQLSLDRSDWPDHLPSLQIGTPASKMTPLSGR